MKKTLIILSLFLILLALAGCGHEHVAVIDAAILPTCTAEGLSEGVHCADCGEIITPQQVIAKTEHKAVADAAVPATCTAEGLTEGAHCADCGEILMAQQVIAKTEHKAVADAAVPATCTAEGLTEGAHCADCGEILMAQQVIAKTEHNSVTDAAVPATCTAEGLTEGAHCADCGEVLTPQQATAKTAHTPVTDEAVPASCIAEGLTEGSHCAHCNAVLTPQQTVAKTQHQYKHIPPQPATCTASGLAEHSKCSICGGLSMTPRVLPATGHVYAVTPAGDNHEKRCVTCDYHFSEPHTYHDDGRCTVCQYSPATASAEEKQVIGIFTRQLDTAESMTEFSKMPYDEKYRWRADITSWGPTAKGTCNVRAGDIRLLSTSGYAAVTLDPSGTKVIRSWMMLSSNTRDTDNMSPIIWRDRTLLRNLGITMANEISAALDVLLGSLGDYSVTEFLLSVRTETPNAIKFVPTPQPTDNAVEGFKAALRDMMVFEENVPISKYSGEVRMEIQTADHLITIESRSGGATRNLTVICVPNE